MNRDDFLDEIKKDINELLKEPRLANYKKQLFSWKLNAKFNRTFSENYLWNRALFLTTNGCILLKENPKEKSANNALYESAEIYEYLSDVPNISEIFDKDYLLVLSALCYDLSGYQANAYCLASKMTDYNLSSTNKSIDLSADNKIIEQIKMILLKKIDIANHTLIDDNLKNDLGYSLFCNASGQWYSYILKQKEGDYINAMHNVYFYYLFSGNTYIAHLLFLLEVRIFIFTERSIWINLERQEGITVNNQWKKYARLLAYDYYENNSIKKIEDRKSIFEFWTSQLRAIENGLLSKDENFVVQMPTSAGKTFIAELLILKHLINSPGKKCIYIAPFRALTNEKEGELGKYFGTLGYSVSSLSGSYEIDAFQDIVMNETDLLIATPEKIDVLLRFKPDFFNNISLLVIDEGHIIGDISPRATLLEFLIIRLRIKLPELRTLFISAVMPIQNANEYSVWLSGKETNVLRSLKYDDSSPDEEWEPTRKLISRFEWNGTKGDIRFRGIVTGDETPNSPQGAVLYGFLTNNEYSNKYPHVKNKPETTAALAYKLSKEGNTLVFCAMERRIKTIANALLSLLKLEGFVGRFQENKNKQSAFYSDMWYGQDSFVTNSINHGIGIHYGDMPEQVRASVEDDFRNGHLAILLSTNTIGQGLNFPIKNLIFYETQINRVNNRNVYIQHRDFWNIIGRAGRAGKETEGNVVFVINTENDKRLYLDFINKTNIESAESLVFKALRILLEDGIDSEGFSTVISELSETYLLDLITEESLGTEYEEMIEKLIDNSLFKIQIDKNRMDMNPLKNEFRKIFKSFEHDTTFYELQKYKSTGLSFKSNKLVKQFIEENIDELNTQMTNDDYLGIIASFIRLISNNSISEMTNNKLNNIFNPGQTPYDFMPIIEKWIAGASLADIMNIWTNQLNYEIRKLHIFISQGLYYLYPWGLSAFLLILSYKIEKEYVDLPDNIRNSASYLKFGLNTATSCLARSLGIKSRQISNFLSEKSNHLKGNDFIRWFSNLTSEEVEEFNIPSFEKENIINVSLKLTPKSSSTLLSSYYNFVLKGTNFNNNWAIKSKSIKVGEKLDYKRDEQNKYDPFAILILKDNSPIGYIPREKSRFISSEIDIEDKSYDITVTKVDKKDGYSEISVNMFQQIEFVE